VPVEAARDLASLRARVAGWRRAGLRIGLVPTMGALHEGHLALVRRALDLADRCVVSIFVNPTQFAPSEDLDRYPRDEPGDLALLERAGAQLAWIPATEVMYPPGGSTWVTVEGVSEGLEAETRPHFFRGVATVCAKLFGQVGADLAVFGEKDYQQLLVVRRLVLDLAIPTEIVAYPTVREPDGLAMSSRNRYLDPAERQTAASLYGVLRATASELVDGCPAEPPLAAARQRLLAAGFDDVDYVALRDAHDLRPLEHANGRPARLLAAARLGATRLIDNVAVGAA